MAYADNIIDPAVALASTADNVRADLKTLYNAAHDSLTTELVTDVGFSATGPVFLSIVGKLLKNAERAAKEAQDHS